MAIQPDTPATPHLAAGQSPRSEGSGLLLTARGAAFIAGACIMTVELIAGNVIAGYLGGSLYTWTSVIGVIMAGISLGNILGGKAADRWPPSGLLAALLLSSAAACATIHAVNEWIGVRLDGLDVTPARIAMHVLVVFILPSVLLGAISPVLVTMALGGNRSTGRTVGSIYAANAAGSILGTFAAGFWLVPRFPTSRIILLVSAALGLMGVAFAARQLLRGPNQT